MSTEAKIISYKEINIQDSDLDNLKYKYQEELTKKLDAIDYPFTQEVLNEIILWKVNRFGSFSDETIALVNKIKPTDTTLDEALTREVLEKLLNKDQQGVRLAMASTILRFKNPKVYQIIDQRVYRFIYGKEFKYTDSNVESQIKIYLDYLEELRKVCAEIKIEFSKSDRILYTMDKKYNKEVRLNGF